MDLIQESALSFFSLIHDPRKRSKCKHKLSEVIAIAVCARLTGAEHFTEMEDFGLECESWLRQFLVLEHGVPSHDTFRRVFCLIEQEYFEKIFKRWAKTLSGETSQISIDGKTVNGTFGKMNEGPRPVTLVSVYDRDSGLVFSQAKAPSTGNAEVSAALECIKGLNLKNTLVTVDAGIGRKAFLRNILEKEADYATPVKRNAGSRFVELQNYAAKMIKSATKAQSIDEGHGRREHRIAYAMGASGLSAEFLKSYPGTKSVILFERVREEKDKRYFVQKTGPDGKQYYEKNNSEIKRTETTVLYVSSRKLGAREALDKIRAHWGIENKLHWTLDVIFKEDGCPVRERNCAANLALLRKIAFNMILCCPKKGSKKLKMRRAALNRDYLKSLLLNVLKT
jgi:predicted transposase YbfD/YdcC